MSSASAHNGETRPGLPITNNYKTDKIYKATVFRHWTTGGIEFPSLSEEKHIR